MVTPIETWVLVIVMMMVLALVLMVLMYVVMVLMSVVMVLMVLMHYSGFSSQPDPRP